MKSKHFELNTFSKKLYERLKDWSIGKEVFIPIDFLDYDYLAYECFDGRHQVRLAEEVNTKYADDTMVRAYYHVEYTEWISLPDSTSREFVLEEMALIKEGMLSFENSFFHDYYQSTNQLTMCSGSQYKRIQQLEELLKGEKE